MTSVQLWSRSASSRAERVKSRGVVYEVESFSGVSVRH
jgi:hypothetical protein